MLIRALICLFEQHCSLSSTCLLVRALLYLNDHFDFFDEAKPFVASLWWFLHLLIGSSFIGVDSNTLLQTHIREWKLYFMDKHIFFQSELIFSEVIIHEIKRWKHAYNSMFLFFSLNNWIYKELYNLFM